MHSGAEMPFKTNCALCDLLSEGTAHYAQVFSFPAVGTDLEGGSPLVIEEEKLLVFLKDLRLVRNSAAFDEPPPDLDTYGKNGSNSPRKVDLAGNKGFVASDR